MTVIANQIRIRAVSLALALVAAQSAFAALPSQPPATPEEQLASLDWLAGSWLGRHEEAEWEAVYTTPACGAIVSANKEFKDGKLVMIEFEHFRVEDGKVVLSPFPYGRKSKSLFALSECDAKARRAVFACPENDFPSEIAYERTADDRLTIVVKGARGNPLVLTLKLARREP